MRLLKSGLRFFLSLFIFCSFLLDVSCQDKTGDIASGKEENIPDKGAIVFKIDASKTFQTIQNFGASDAWSCQFVGHWPDQKKQAIADLLFSQNLDDKGNPKGIGLSLWRFNIGAGSAQQGQQSGINDVWRRAESFLEPDGSYNWDRQAGQVWFAKAAKNLGVDKLLIFPNSPPVNMTTNGKAYSSDGNSNLTPEKYDDFASYLSTVVSGFKDKGLAIDYISPVNEPQWDWSDGGQEGTPFDNEAIASIVRNLDNVLEQKNLSAKIDIAEAGQIDYLYETGNKPGRGDQVNAFFDKDSPSYIGNLSHMANTISGHSYFTTSPYATAVEKRTKLAKAVEQIPDLQYWMSEYCILGDNAGEMDGNGRDLGVNPALYLARVIYNDLTVSQASAWQWWLAISPYDYKDGLIYIDKQKEDGNFYPSKMLWALGNYSRFIRPGFQRISIKNLQHTDIDPGFLCSAYKNPATEEIIAVIVNSTNDDKDISLDLVNDSLKEVESYTTSSGKDLEHQLLDQNEPVKIAARSITTLKIDYR